MARFKKKNEREIRNEDCILTKFESAFYPSFLVGNLVVVTSNNYMNKKSHKWVSDGVKKLFLTILS